MIGIVSIKRTLREHSGHAALVTVLLVFQVLLFATGGGSLLSPVNIASLIQQNSYVVILSLGMLMLLVSGGNIDFSIGASVGMLSSLASVLIGRMNFSTASAIVITIACGILIGVWNGFWITIVRVPAFLVTIIGMFILRGISLVLLTSATVGRLPVSRIRYTQIYFPSSGNTIAVCVAAGAIFALAYILVASVGRMRRRKFGESLFMGSTGVFALKMAVVFILSVYFCYILGQTRGFSSIFLLACIIILFSSFVTQRTVMGRYLYAMGGNERAARLSGINTTRTLFLAYVNMGFLASVAAIISIGRFNTLTTADEPLINTLGACFIGGVSAYGGRGKVSDVVAGAAVMAFLNDGMFQIGIPSRWHHIVQGLILILVLAVNILINKKETARQA